MERSRLISLAQEVRNHIECTLTPTYFGKDLACTCAISSWTLWRLLLRHGIASNFVIGRYYGFLSSYVENCLHNDVPIDWEYIGIGHCWVEVGKEILDITLTQFEKVDSVCILGHDDKLNYHYPLLRNVQAIREINKEWPKEQKPKTYNKYLRRILK